MERSQERERGQDGSVEPYSVGDITGETRVPGRPKQEGVLGSGWLRATGSRTVCDGSSYKCTWVQVHSKSEVASADVP